MDDPIVEYLAELRRELRCSRRRKNVLVAEVEDHLRERTAARGGGETAAREAISTFGPSDSLAKQLSGSGWRLWTAFHWYVYATMFGGLLLILLGSALVLSVLPGTPFADESGSHALRLWRDCTAYDPSGECIGTWVDRTVSAATVAGVLLIAAGMLVGAGHWVLRRALLDATDAQAARRLFHMGGSATLVGLGLLLLVSGLFGRLASDEGIGGHPVWLALSSMVLLLGGVLYVSGRRNRRGRA